MSVERLPKLHILSIQILLNKWIFHYIAAESSGNGFKQSSTLHCPVMIEDMADILFLVYST